MYQKREREGERERKRVLFVTAISFMDPPTLLIEPGSLPVNQQRGVLLTLETATFRVFGN